MRRRTLLGVIISLLALSMLTSSAFAESGYASPEFQIRGDTFLTCIDTSPNPDLSDRRNDSFECVVDPAISTPITVSGDLYQVVFIRYKRFIYIGPVNFNCDPINGRWNRYAGKFNNMACSA